MQKYKLINILKIKWFSDSEKFVATEYQTIVASGGCKANTAWYKSVELWKTVIIPPPKTFP